jgi:UDP-glucose 4-epimerase
VDYVFHLAAMVSVPESMASPAECVEINATGTLVLLEEAAAAGVKKLCLSSSAAIYGDDPTVPKLENMPPQPKSPYASTKLDGETYCQTFQEAGPLHTASLRYFNVFGPRQDPGSAYAAAVPIFIHQALKNEDITIYGDGEQTRDFIYVKDIVAANRHLAMTASAGGVYNVAYGRRMTIRDLAERIIRLTGSTSRIVFGPERAGDVKHSMASVDKLKSTGFIPGADFEEGLQATLEFFRDA